MQVPKYSSSTTILLINNTSDATLTYSKENTLAVSLAISLASFLFVSVTVILAK